MNADPLTVWPDDPQPGASGCYTDALVLLIVWTPLIAVALGVAALLRRLSR